MRFTTILFDFDGTLAVSRVAIIDTVHEVLSHFGHTIKPHHKDFTGMYPVRQLYQEYATDTQEVNTMRDHHLRVQFKHMHKYTLVPGAFETLHKLKQRELSLALVTSANKLKIQHLLKLLGIHAMFDFIVTADDVTYPKPHKEPFELALHYFHASPDQCLMVGNTEADIAGARGAGIKSVAVAYDHNEQEMEKLEPDYVIRTFDKLCDIIF